MDVGPHVSAIRDDLAALIGADEAVAASLERLDRAVEASIQLRLLDAVGQAGLELSEQLPAGHVEVRLSGRDVQLVYVGPALPEAAPPDEDEEGGTARLTLRMPESLKTKAEEAAAREGLSVNAWLVRAVSRELAGRPAGFEPPRGRTGRRITGFAQS